MIDALIWMAVGSVVTLVALFAWFAMGFWR